MPNVEVHISFFFFIVHMDNDTFMTNIKCDTFTLFFFLEKNNFIKYHIQSYTATFHFYLHVMMLIT